MDKQGHRCTRAGANDEHLRNPRIQLSHDAVRSIVSLDSQHNSRWKFSPQVSPLMRR
jgi:hypothetical protein